MIRKIYLLIFLFLCNGLLFSKNIDSQSVDSLENKTKHEVIQLQASLLNHKKTISKKNYQLLIAIFLGGLLTILSIIVICILIRRLKNKENLLIEKNKKFQQEIELKNRELLCSVNNIFAKNYLISKIARKLSDSLGDFRHTNFPLINYVINELKQTMDETGWKEFEIYFSKIHQTFYENLNKKFPNLSNREKKLCALIKLNMSNKEIATLTMTKIESVHTARSRLRKKMNLNDNSNISELLNTL